VRSEERGAKTKSASQGAKEQLGARNLPPIDNPAAILRFVRGAMVGRNVVNFRVECFLGHEEHEDYTKSTKENHCQGYCMRRVFVCFHCFVTDQYFLGSKGHKDAYTERFSLWTSRSTVRPHKGSDAEL
jgi:hypothetical protein